MMKIRKGPVIILFAMMSIFAFPPDQSLGGTQKLDFEFRSMLNQLSGAGSTAASISDKPLGTYSLACPDGQDSCPEAQPDFDPELPPRTVGSTTKVMATIRLSDTSSATLSQITALGVDLGSYFGKGIYTEY